MSITTEFQLEYTKIDENTPSVSAIIVAAGSGTRMGCDKQMLSLLGIPVLARTLLSFQQCLAIGEIIIVTKDTSMADVQHLVDIYEINKVKSIVAGGVERQDSVMNGLAEVSEDMVYIAIHDGARPLITPEEIQQVITLAGETGAAGLAVPVKDTIKRVDQNNKIIETPLRSSLMAMQTPQVFDISLYKQALCVVEELGLLATDDCQIMETAGYSVYTVEGSYRNIKITTPDDVALAEILLAKENLHD